MKAKELLTRGQSAIVIFTDGTRFRDKPNGTGWTGEWRINPDRKYDKVIIYRRDRITQTSQVFVADKKRLREEASGRHTILLENIRPQGPTDTPWPEFVEGGRNPIQYLP